jgi:hypothetical protein
MRLSVATLRRLVKGDLRIEFVRQELTRTAGSNCSGGICGRSTCPVRQQGEYTGQGGDYGGARPGLLLLAPCSTP